MTGKMEKELTGTGRMLADPKLGGIDNPVAIVFAHMFGNGKNFGVEIVEGWKANFQIYRRKRIDGVLGIGIVANSFETSMTNIAKKVTKTND